MAGNKGKGAKAPSYTIIVRCRRCDGNIYIDPVSGFICGCQPLRKWSPETSEGLVRRMLGPGPGEHIPAAYRVHSLPHSRYPHEQDPYPKWEGCWKLVWWPVSSQGPRYDIVPPYMELPNTVEVRASAETLEGISQAYWDIAKGGMCRLKGGTP